MDKYFNTYREMISLRGLSDHTLKSYCTYIRSYLDYLSNILHRQPEDVSWADLRDYIRWLQKERKLSDRTVNHAISQLRFFTIYVLHKPWDDTQLPMRKFDTYLPFVPSHEEAVEFISSISDLKQKAMISLLYASGLRVGEVCSLKYSDIERKNMRIHIRHSKNRSDRYYRCCAETLLELSKNQKWLGATPGIIQVLHTWNQEIDYHVHMHCIISGAGLTKDRKIRKSKSNFFIPVNVLRDKFKGKYMDGLSSLYEKGSLTFSSSCKNLHDPDQWKKLKNNLYEKDWCPYIKETFNGFGNAIEYLGRYTHKIAISNNRILAVTEDEVTFSARGKKPGEPKRQITLDHTEFIRRYLMHVLPSGFQKIRYYGFLNNRMKTQNLKVIFKLQNGRRFKQRYAGMSMAELLKAVWNFDICLCPKCGHPAMKQLGRCHVPPS